MELLFSLANVGLNMATVSVDETLQLLSLDCGVRATLVFVMSDDSFKANQSLRKET